MLNREIATRYAYALFFFAKQRGLLDTAYDQLGALQTSLERDRALLNFLTAPQIADDKKEALIQRVFANRFDVALVEFFLLLARKRRIAYLVEIIDHFRDLVSEAKGMTKVTVTTAFHLDAEQRQRFIQRLEVRTKGAVRLVEHRDPRAMGGAKIQIKDHALDGTVRTALTNLRRQLEAVEITR